MKDKCDCKKISKILNYKGKLINNTKKPDGIKSKLMNNNLSKKHGWSANISLDKGLKN